MISKTSFQAINTFDQYIPIKNKTTPTKINLHTQKNLSFIKNSANFKITKIGTNSQTFQFDALLDKQLESHFELSSSPKETIKMTPYCGIKSNLISSRSLVVNSYNHFQRKKCEKGKNWSISSK